MNIFADAINPRFFILRFRKFLGELPGFHNIQHRLRSGFTMPAYPLLFSILPILLLYGFNKNELTISVIFVPIFFSLSFALATLIPLSKITKNFDKSAFLVFSAMAIFYSHGHITKELTEREIHSPLTVFTVDELLMILWVIILLIITLILVKLPFHNKVTQILNVTIGILIVFNIASIGQSLIQTGKQENDITAHTLGSQAQNDTSEEFPDIYYLVFDRYANKSTLESYGYNNNSFYSSLEEMGFKIYHDSYASYPKTSLSLTSTLHMNYLQNLFPIDPKTTIESNSVFPYFKDHLVGWILQDYGYTYHHLGSWYTPTSSVNNSDINYTSPNTELMVFDSFPSKILSTTMYPAISETFLGGRFGIDDLDFAHKELANFEFNTLSELVTEPSPKLVFAHVLLPHPPFVFDSKCNNVHNSLFDEELTIDKYVQQLQCTNSRIIDLVKHIQKNGNPNSIIVLTADEGPYSKVNHMSGPFNFSTASDAAVLERAGILNAVYFPDHVISKPPDRFIPVNQFREIFNRYFNKDFAILEAKTYVFRDENNLFDMRDVGDLSSKQ